MLPTQIYKPKNFPDEVEIIKSKTRSRFNYFRECWELIDNKGNVFEIDYNDGTISVN